MKLYRDFLTLTRKDFMVEFRDFSLIAAILFLSIFLALAAAFGIKSAFLSLSEQTKFYPAALWLCFIFSTSSQLGRIYDNDLKNAAINNLITAGVNIKSIYFSKLLLCFTITVLINIFTAIFLAVLINLADILVFLNFTILFTLICIGYSSIICLLAAISANTRMRNTLLPLILLPLSFPLILAGLELSQEILVNKGIDFNSTWITLLVVLDVLYLFLGSELFEYIIRE